MMVRSAFVLLVALTGLSAIPAVSAELVTFEDGRGLVVEAWEAERGVITLRIEGGGAISVPAEQVTSIRPYERAVVTDDPEFEAWRLRAGAFADPIADAAARYDLSPGLLAAMALVESNFDPFAVSSKGACGILQLLPETADRFGVSDVFDVHANLDGGAKYLRWLLNRFEGRTDLALAAYNAGERAVDRHGGIPPYNETRRYVAKVLQHAGLDDRRGPGVARGAELEF